MEIAVVGLIEPDLGQFPTVSQIVTPPKYLCAQITVAEVLACLDDDTSFERATLPHSNDSDMTTRCTRTH